MKQGTAIILFILAVFITILLLAAASIALVCSRPPRMPHFTPRVWHTPDSELQTRHSYYNTRRPPSYASSIITRRETFLSDTTNTHPESPQSDMISVSPSNPVLIGSESQEGGIVKLMITPPTPSKAKLGMELLEGFTCEIDIEEEGSSESSAYATAVEEK